MLGEFFNPQFEFVIQEGVRPHWSQTGVVVFITARLHDSIPKTVLHRWEREKQDWMLQRGYQGHWSEALPSLDQEEQHAFRRHFHRCREELLDNSRGRCLLRERNNAGIVAESLLYFDGERYEMGDFIVMPNHIHLLASFPDETAMRDQCASWLHYTAAQINRRTRRKGKLWQQEPFDHLVRSLEQYEYLRRYIAENPKKAGLPPGSYLYRRYPDQMRSDPQPESSDGS